MAEVYKVLQPTKYLREFISRDIRPDGRKFDEHRWTVINPKPLLTADGSCIAKIGHSKIVCGIKAELCAPAPENPCEGFIVTNLELPPLCSSQFRPGPPGDTAQACNQLIADIFKDSKCIDCKDLCIYKDKLVWSLYCDMVCVDYDGSIVDASLLALTTALRTVNLPHVEYNPDMETTTVSEVKCKPLNIKNLPVASTFTLFESETMLTDPTNDEEKLCGGPLGGTVIVKQLNMDKTVDSNLIGVHRLGGAPLNEKALEKAISITTSRAKQIQELIEKVA